MSGGYPLFTLVYYESGLRQRRTFSDMDEAKLEADKIADRLERGQREIIKLKDSDAEGYVHAVRDLAPFGIPLHVAIGEYIKATKALDGRGTVLEACKEFAARASTGAKKTVCEVITEFLKAKEDDGMSTRYLMTLRASLAPLPADAGAKVRRRNSFGESFKTYIETIRANQIEDWLRARKVGPRTRWNLLLTIRTLFNYAKSRGYLSRGEPTEADEVMKPKLNAPEIGIFTPAQLTALFRGSDLHPAHAEYQLFIAIGAFTGLRTEEIKRLEWEDIQSTRGVVEVKARNSKTKRRRLVPINSALTAWLALYPAGSGKVFSRPRAEERAHLYAERLGVKWPPNGLRHSYATYRVGVTQDMPRVALEMGNSPAIIERFYKELATESEAKAWFAIMPKQPANVVAMKGAA